MRTEKGLGECSRHHRTGRGEGGAAVARPTNPTCELYNQQRERLGSGVPAEAAALATGSRPPRHRTGPSKERGTESLSATELSIILSLLERYQTSWAATSQDIPKKQTLLNICGDSKLIFKQKWKISHESKGKKKKHLWDGFGEKMLCF